MRARRREWGSTVIEVTVVLVLVAIVLGLAYANWRGPTGQQQLRYGVAQVATDLRQAQERAKEARLQYTVTFTAGSSAYVIAAAGGAFTENARLPDGVTAAASEVVTFSAFGQPDAAHTITIQSALGSGTVTVTAMGGITYQTPFGR